MPRAKSESTSPGPLSEGLLEAVFSTYRQSCIAVRELEGAAMSLSSEELRDLIMVYAAAERQRGRVLATMIQALGGARPTSATIVLGRDGISNRSLIGGCRAEQRSLRRAYERLLAGAVPQRFEHELRAQLRAVRQAEEYLRVLEEHADL